MRRAVPVLFLPLVLLAVPLAGVTAEAAAPAIPGRLTSVTAEPGPRTGQVTLHWKQDGSHTTGYVLETALTSFSPTSSSMPRHGRGSELTSISAGRRSITLSAGRVAALGAGTATGNHLYFRFSAVNRAGAGTSTRAYPYLQTVLPRPGAAKAKGTRLRVASFNVRTARATSDRRSWIKRAPAVAREIVAHHPGVVALQELGPGRADGRTGTLQGHQRQTDSLTAALAKVGGKRYRLVRTTSYAKPGTPSGTQGARILYDSHRYTLLSDCPETTGGSGYSSSCSAKLPLLRSDSEKSRRRAAFALLKDRSTGKKFWLVSAHLDERHSGTKSKEQAYNTLRGSQARKILSALAAAGAGSRPVVVAGDMNSWQNNQVGNRPHSVFVDAGYYDTSAARERVDFAYPTMNAFRTTLTRSSQGVGPRIDMILIRGVRGVNRFENVMKVTDPSRPSDHNMILTDTVL